jgi:tetratricopeptide (TPR) repeat protein
MKKTVPVLSFIFSLFFGIALSFGQNVSAEAQRYFDRGTAAMEMKDFQAAIREFGQAAKLAPDWPDAVYNLGAAHEIAEHYEEAIKCYREYVRLAPDAEDAESTRTLINKLEYKAEREKILTNGDIAEIIASLGGSGTWYIAAQHPDKTDVLGNSLISSIIREGDHGIRVPNMLVSVAAQGVYQVVEQESYQHVSIDGPFVKFNIEVSHVGYPIVPPYRTGTWTFEIEVLSKASAKVINYSYWPNGQRTDPWTVTYKKIQFEKEESSETGSAGSNAYPRTSTKSKDINAKDEFGRTPLHNAAIQGRMKLAEELIGEGADVNSRDNGGYTPLHGAAGFGRKEVAEMLIARGAALNARNNDGDTPLYTAAAWGHKDVVTLLAAKGADMNVVNNAGKTARQAAASRNHKEVAELLKEYGAK